MVAVSSLAAPVQPVILTPLPPTNYNNAIPATVSDKDSLSPQTESELSSITGKLTPHHKNKSHKKKRKHHSPSKTASVKTTAVRPMGNIEDSNHVVIQHGAMTSPGLIDNMSEAAMSHKGRAEGNVRGGGYISVLRNATQNDDDTLLNEAYHALMVGQLEAATVYYKKVLKREPHNESASFGLATIYQRSGEDQQARELYTEILTRDPRNQDALNNFLVLVADEAPESSITELKKLEAVSPSFSPIPAQIGMIYAKMGNDIKAARYLNKAMLLSPDNITYQYNLAIIFDRMHQKKEAITLYKALIEASDKGAILPDAPDRIKDRLLFLSSN